MGRRADEVVRKLRAASPVLAQRLLRMRSILDHEYGVVEQAANGVRDSRLRETVDAFQRPRYFGQHDLTDEDRFAPRFRFPEESFDDGGLSDVVVGQMADNQVSVRGDHRPPRSFRASPLAMPASISSTVGGRHPAGRRSCRMPADERRGLIGRMVARPRLTVNSSPSPSCRPSSRRTALGTVTWPLLVIVATFFIPPYNNTKCKER